MQKLFKPTTMSYEQRPGGGSLFKNEKTQDKQPDYQGEIVTLDGKKFRLAAWVKEGKKGKFFSLKMSEPRPQDPKNDSNELPF